jgi:hypothetical protein
LNEGKILFIDGPEMAVNQDFNCHDGTGQKICNLEDFSLDVFQKVITILVSPEVSFLFSMLILNVPLA